MYLVSQMFHLIQVSHTHASLRLYVSFQFNRVYLLQIFHFSVCRSIFMWHISKCNTEKSYKCIWCLRCFIYASQSITPKHHSSFTFYFSLTKYIYYKCFIFQSTEVYSFEKIHSTTRKKKLQNVPIITIFSPFFFSNQVDWYYL